MNRSYRFSTGISRRARGVAIAFSALLLLTAFSTFAPRAQATFIGSTVQIDVSSSLGSGSYTLNVPAIGDQIDWDTGATKIPVFSTVGHTWLADVKQVEVHLDGDPNAFVFFSVLAGGVDTHFSVSSALVGFTPIAGAIGTASGGVTLTDTTGNGAYLNGTFPGITSFQAEYNNGIVFADLVAPAATPLTSIQNGALTGVPIVPPVFNIQSKFDFVLSAGDIGSGTGNFTITPEPSSICLAILGGAGLAFIARRRRKA
jgi:hypothetical protein